ncbi:hypothetical protein D6D23_06504 [Aureobasidium pullulans]|nr:hypothetical protein D6D23_06504 [Aureobasidium pullulans]
MKPFANGAVDLGHVLRETEMNMPQEITNFSLQNDLSPPNNLLVIDQSRVLGSGDTQENTIWRWTAMPLSGSMTGVFISVQDVTHEGMKRPIALDTGHDFSTTAGAEQCKQQVQLGGSKDNQGQRTRHYDEYSSSNERNQQILQVIDMVGISLFECDLKGTLVHANKTWLNSNDHGTRENAYLDLIHTLADEPNYVASQWELAASGTPVSFETRYKSDDSTGKDVIGTLASVALLPVFDPNGAARSILGCTTNTAAQRLATSERSRETVDALARERFGNKRLFDFAEESPVGIFQQGRVTYVNPAWFEQTGHPVVPFDQIDWPQVIHDEDKKVAETFWKGVVTARTKSTVQVRMKREWYNENGESMGPVWILTNAIPEFDEDGSISGVIGTMEDISAIKFAETVQKTRMEEALEARRQQEHFIDMTSHEIRNPLGAVMHCADALLENLAETKAILANHMVPDHKAEQRIKELVQQSIESVSTIISCSAHQLRIADDVLVLSKLDSKLLQLAPTPTHAMSLLANVDRSFEAEAANNLVQLETQVDPSLQGLDVEWVTIDPGRVQQILVNVVSNALKFSKKRSVRKVTVRMGASSTPPTQELLGVEFTVSHIPHDYSQESLEDDPASAAKIVYLHFAVTDTGTGLTKEEKSKLFTRFSQASARTYNEYGGSGLGLCISQQLCEMQGGRIGLASEPDVGSTFAFFVKAYRTNPPPPPKSILLRQNSASLSADQTPKTKISILVVEDNVVNQRLLQMQLVKRGYQVVVADNGQEALDFIQTTRHWSALRSSSDRVIDLILMDVEMPVLDGLSATRKIREYEQQGLICDHIPIIAVSANARAEQTAQAIASGMDDTITKPFRMVDLIKKLDVFTALVAP